MEDNKKDLIFRIINILIFLSIIISCIVYLHYITYQHDDFIRAFFYSNSIKDFILSADQGRYISTILNVLTLDGLSKLLNIHPQDNIYLLPAIKGAFLALLFYLISKLFYIDNKNKTVNPIVYACVVIASACLFPFNYFNSLNLNTQFFCYTFNLIFFWLALFILGKCFLNNKLPDKKDIPLCIVIFVLLGISSHVNFVTFTGALLFIGIYLFIQNRNNLKTFFSNIFNYKIFIPIIALLSGILLSILSSDFQTYYHQRTPEEAKLLFSLSHFPDFTLQWIKHVFLVLPNVILITIAILITIFAFVYMRKQNDFSKLRNILLAWAIIFGAAFFNYTLITCGKTFYLNNSYWVVHPELQLMTNFYFLMAVVILCSSLFKYIKYKKIFSVSILILLLFAFYPLINIRLVSYNWNYQNSMIQKKLLYESEKACVFYAYKGINTAILPKSLILESNYWVVELGLWKNNFKKIHGFYPPNIIRFVPEDEFLQIVKKDGLTFSEEELRDMKFTNLLNKDYVLFGEDNNNN